MASKAQRGWKLFHSLRVASVLVGGAFIALSGCSSGGSSTYGVDDNPEISVLVDGQKLSDNTCAHFGTDDTNGVIKQSKKLTITNTGSKGLLCVKKISFTTTSTKLMTIAYGPHTLDTATCPGGLASLDVGKSLIATVTYAPSPGEEDKATLDIEHNDYKDTTKYNNMCFDISAAGPIIELQTKELPWTNPKASAPTEKCAYFGNVGSAALVVTKLSDISPNSPEYKITQQPTVGDQISPLGSTDNPPNNKKLLKVCLVMTPDSNPDNDEVQLHIYTNDPVTGDSTVRLYSKFEAASSFTVTCQGNDPSVIEYNFQGAGQGVTRVCNVHNDGPSPFAWNNPPTIAAIAPSTQDEVDAVYALTLQKNGQPRGKPYSAGSIAIGQSVDFSITYTPPTNGMPPPAAKLLIPYTQTPNPPQTVEIAILAASCDTPTLVFAPDTMWLYAEKGNKAQGHIVFANQSCAPLDVLKACVNNGTSNPSGSDPCASPQYASKYHGLVTPVGASKIAPSAAGGSNGQFGIDIEFHPPDDNKINANDLLHVVYCITGSVSGGDCKAGYQTINLTGNTTAGVKLPSAILSVDTATPASGKPCIISGALTLGGFPDGKTWKWALIERPAGSKAWIGDSSQSTSDASVSFVPDAKGKYTVQAMALTIIADDPNQLAWTPPTTVSLTVQ